MRALFLVFLLLFCLARPGSAAPVRILVCGGDSEWPPSSFFKRDKGRPTGEISGLSPDLLKRIFAGSEFEPVFTLQPWARCQRDVLKGDQQIAMGGTFNQDRLDHYLLSRRYFAVTPGYFYWKPFAPAGGFKVSSAQDLKKFRVCGMTGHNYEAIGLQPGEMDVGPGGYDAAVARLSHKRCDLFIENVEVVKGLVALGEPALQSKDLAARAVPGVAPLGVHFMISRASPHAQELLNRINERLEAMESSGELARLTERYLTRD